MSEHSLHSGSEQRSDAYRTDRDPAADIEHVRARLDQLSVPTDVHDRANDVAESFNRPQDIQMLLAAIHDVAVPGIATREVDYTVQAESRDGTQTALAAPNERQAIFEAASAMINELALKRGSNEATDQAFLDRVGNIVALAGVWAHSYADGNGRTARIVGDLLRYGPDSGNLSVAMKGRDEYGPEDIRIASYVPKGHTSPADALAAAASLDIPLDDEPGYLEITGSRFSTPYTA